MLINLSKLLVWILLLLSIKITGSNTCYYIVGSHNLRFLIFHYCRIFADPCSIFAILWRILLLIQQRWRVAVRISLIIIHRSRIYQLLLTMVIYLQRYCVLQRDLLNYSVLLFYFLENIIELVFVLLICNTKHNINKYMFLCIYQWLFVQLWLYL